MNDRFCRFIGHPREHLLGKSDRDIFPKHEADVFWSKEDAVFASGVVEESEERVTDGTGREHVVLTARMLHTDRNGRRLVVGTIVNTTRRKEAEHALVVSEARYRRLFEAARDGILILILDCDSGVIVDVNPFVVELTGYPREHFLGMHLWEIGPFKDVAASPSNSCSPT
jgi:PAS domain S-box-containing protein